MSALLGRSNLSITLLALYPFVFRILGKMVAEDIEVMLLFRHAHRCRAVALVGLPCIASLSVLSLVNTARPAAAQTVHIAVFGDNQIDDFINGSSPSGNILPGYAATLVTDADLAGGILSRSTNPFSAFFYTRPTGLVGSSLSAAAAANVSSFVGGVGGTANVVLLNGDFADALAAPTEAGPPVHDTNIARLIANATAYAAASGHGFVGEYTGALAALTSNENTTPTVRPLGLIGGNGSPLSLGEGGSDGSLFALQAANPVLAGVTLPYNPTPGTLASVEFGSTFTGVDPVLVVATFGSGAQSNPAVIVRAGNVVAAAAPEPASLALLGLGGLPLAGMVVRRRRSA